MYFPRLLLEQHGLSRRSLISNSRHAKTLRSVKTMSFAGRHVCSILLTLCLWNARSAEATSSYSAASHCYTILRGKEKRALGPIADVPEMPHCPAATVP